MVGREAQLVPLAHGGVFCPAHDAMCKVTLGVIPVSLLGFTYDARSRCHSLVWLRRDGDSSFSGLVPSPSMAGSFEGVAEPIGRTQDCLLLDQL